METGIRTLTATDLSQYTPQKLEAFGAVAQTSDGRRFRYCGAGAGLTAGNLAIGASTTSGHLNVSVAVAAKANDTSVVVTLGAAAATADQYADGYLVVGVDGSGVPITRRIKGNTSGNASTQITVFLYQTEPLAFALTTSNVVSLVPNPFSSVTASSTAGNPAGVATSSIPSGNYGWIQVYGPCGLVNDAAGALSALGKLKQSTTVSGSVVNSTAATDIQIGYVIQPAAASKAFLAQLNMD